MKSKVDLKIQCSKKPPNKFSDSAQSPSTAISRAEKIGSKYCYPTWQISRIIHLIKSRSSFQRIALSLLKFWTIKVRIGNLLCPGRNVRFYRKLAPSLLSLVDCKSRFAKRTNLTTGGLCSNRKL